MFFRRENETGKAELIKQIKSRIFTKKIETEKGKPRNAMPRSFSALFKFLSPKQMTSFIVITAIWQIKICCVLFELPNYKHVARMELFLSYYSRLSVVLKDGQREKLRMICVFYVSKRLKYRDVF